MGKKAGVYLENNAWWAYLGNQPIGYIDANEEGAEERITALFMKELKEPGSVIPWRAKKTMKRKENTPEGAIIIRLSETARQRLSSFQQSGEDAEAAINRILETLPLVALNNNDLP